jgi:hypothetical protein
VLLLDTHETCRASKEMNDLCSPFQFYAVNLMEQNPDPSLEIPARHAPQIRSIRILVDPYTGDEDKRQEEYHGNIVKLLRECPNLQSIALYYRLSGTSIELIADEVIQLLKKGNVEALGIYSVLVLHKDVGGWWWNRILPLSSKQLVLKFLGVAELSRSLRRLDIVTETMDHTTYDVIRLHFPALESLTIRRGIRSSLGRVWDPDQRTKWSKKPKLTHLHIIDCLAGYAPHIPELVRLFSSLKVLTVSTCGNEDDVQPPLRQYGWSSESGALCQVREALEAFHIEHMEDWEIIALGVIPAKHVTLSNIIRGHFVRAMEKDTELFPHLEMLSLTPIPARSDTDLNEANKAEIQAEMEEDKKLKEILDSICKRRGVKVKFDGYCIKPSTGRYGFA